MPSNQPQPSQQAPGPGAYFDIPGIPGGSTQWTEQDETTTNALVNLTQGNLVPFSAIGAFKQTDVVADWWVNFTVAQTYTQGGGTITASAYAPYTLIGPVQLSIQNQYASLDVESGIDWYIFSLIRPYSNAEVDLGTNLGANPAGAPVGGSAAGYPAAALAQPNNVYAGQWTTATTAYNLNLRIPAGQWFDNYFDLSVAGDVLTQGHPALVSPQYMAGTTRVISPRIQMNPGSASTTDNANAVLGGAATFAGSATARIRRKAMYAAANPAILPASYAWQYRQKTNRQAIGAVSQKDLVVPLDSGQVLSIYVRLFDPAAAAGVGAPIALSALTRVNLQFGSGLFAFDAQTVGGLTCAALLQKRWYANHAAALPPGVFAIDLALDERGQMSNKRALNTLNTAGILLHMEFSGVQSASAYATMGVESLVYVA